MVRPVSAPPKELPLAGIGKTVRQRRTPKNDWQGYTLPIDVAARQVAPDELDVVTHYGQPAKPGDWLLREGGLIRVADFHEADALRRGRLQVCRKCGCSPSDACDDGCAWVAEDLCSACPEA
jgi:hypothetical protein